MSRITLILLLFAFSLCLPAFSSSLPPEVEIKELQAEALKVKWKNPDDRPAAVFWLNTEFGVNWRMIEKAVPATGSESLFIPRRGYNKVPSELAIIPADNTREPKILNIASEINEVEFTTQEIRSTDMWIWGDSPAHAPMGINFQPESNAVKNIKGYFLIPIKASSDKMKDQLIQFAPYGNENNIEIQIEGFSGTSVNHGFKIDAAVLGKSHQVIFNIKNPLNLPCY
ncbi:MAG: hypothetical protein HQM10_25995 [Candidatus Riflebacteria bacterium]|nr:hypothetical protein [Candidatus Riflebacteria bacterium]